MNDFDWERTEELLLPQDDGTAWRMACNLMGNGDKAVGKRILRDLLTHVRHADTAHPWPCDLPEKAKYRIASDEWGEYREQYYLAREHGLDDRDAAMCDEAKLAEHDAHMRYEMNDLMAVFIKWQRD